MLTVRQVLVFLSLAFTAYLAARGLFPTRGPLDQPIVMVGTLILYLATTCLCLFWEVGRPGEERRRKPTDGPISAGTRGPTSLPAWAGALALASAIIVPSAVAFAVGPEARTASEGTWYLGGIGALMTIVMVRRRPWIAWMGTIALGIASMVWLGPAQALALGLVGSVLWVVAAQLVAYAMERAVRDTAQLTDLQRAASGWQASQSGRERERRVQVQHAFSVAGPVLTRTIATGGMLEETERVAARIAEGELRDELRGRRLLDDDVREALSDARRRGASVTVLDEGGLDAIDEASLVIIRRELAETLRSSESDRLYIRTSPHDQVAVTVVGRSGSESGGWSDDDSVNLWREIAHPVQENPAP